MTSSLNKKSMAVTIVALCLVFAVGCSSTSKNTLSDNSKSTNSTNQATNITNQATNSASNVTNTANAANNTANTANAAKDSTKNTSASVSQDNSQKTLLNNISQLALQGKIINCDFSTGMPIENVSAKWGKADKTEGVAQAKGYYSTYSKYNVVFGYGKGDLIFEVRSFNSDLKQISLEEVKNTLGTPAYNATSSGQKIVGYTAGKDYKILFVFSGTTSADKALMLDHYSVLYPSGTVNKMGNDSGRQW